jgi:hypothetical protein
VQCLLALYSLPDPFEVGLIGEKRRENHSVIGLLSEV